MDFFFYLMLYSLMFYNNIKFYCLIFLTGHPNNKILKVKLKKKNCTA